MQCSVGGLFMMQTWCFVFHRGHRTLQVIQGQRSAASPSYSLCLTWQILRHGPASAVRLLTQLQYVCGSACRC